MLPGCTALKSWPRKRTQNAAYFALCTAELVKSKDSDAAARLHNFEKLAKKGNSKRSCLVALCTAFTSSLKVKIQAAAGQVAQ